MLILEENDLEGFIEEDILELEGDEAKAKHKKSMVKVKRMIADFYQRPFDPSCLISEDSKADV